MKSDHSLRCLRPSTNLPISLGLDWSSGIAFGLHLFKFWSRLFPNMEARSYLQQRADHGSGLIGILRKFGVPSFELMRINYAVIVIFLLTFGGSSVQAQTLQLHLPFTNFTGNTTLSA